MKHKLHDKFYRKVTKSLLYWKDEWPWVYNYIKNKTIRPTNV